LTAAFAEKVLKKNGIEPCFCIWKSAGARWPLARTSLPTTPKSMADNLYKAGEMAGVQCAVAQALTARGLAQPYW
jgi:hypothetical protein